MMELIKPNLKFKILGDVLLSLNDLQSLTLLYQPIIGVDAFSLYTLFLSLPMGSLQRHDLLLQIMSCKMDHLIESRYRLEAAGLLDVYQSDGLVTYFLKRPLSVKQFLGDAIMRAFLYIKIGIQEFNALKNMLITDVDVINGDKVTKRFDEVFDVRTLSRIDPNLQINNDVRTTGQGIELATVFDSSMLISILGQKGISREIVSLDLLRILNEFAFLYKFDVHELARLVFDALTPDGGVDFAKMKLLARTQFQLMNKGENVQVVVKEEQVPTKQAAASESTEKERIVMFLEQNPIDFLRFKAGGKPPVPADIKLVEWLYTQQGMPAGVINVMIDYVLNYTDGNLPKQLIEKIAGQWQRQGIHTTQAAMEKVAKSLTKSSERQLDKQKPHAQQASNLKHLTRVEPIPEWLLNNKASNDDCVDDLAAKARIEQMKKAMMNKEL